MLTSINEINNFNLNEINELIKNIDTRNDKECEIKIMKQFNNEYINNEDFKPNSDKSSYLMDEKWNYSEIAEYKSPKKWEELFKSSIMFFNDIDYVMEMNKIKNEIIAPYKKDTFKLFNLCEPENVKVIIFSSHPYSSICPIKGIPIATGIPFSVPKGSLQPKDLKNLLEVLQKSYPEDINRNQLNNVYDLEPWYSEGVLLMNSCFTTEIKSKNTHGVMWYGFISKVINFVESKSKYDPIYVFLGRESTEIQCFVKSTSILEYPHPFTYYFKDCKMFKEINDMLINDNIEPIDWKVIF